jgi:hypothetical protein
MSNKDIRSTDNLNASIWKQKSHFMYTKNKALKTNILRVCNLSYFSYYLYSRIFLRNFHFHFAELRSFAEHYLGNTDLRESVAGHSPINLPRFGRTYYIHLQQAETLPACSHNLLFDPEDGCSTFLRNVDTLLPDCTELHSRI